MATIPSSNRCDGLVYERSVELNAPADRVWHAMKQPSVMLHVCRGLIWLPGIEGRIDPVVEGESGAGWIFLFRLIPMAHYRIHVDRVDEHACQLVTTERSALVCVQHTASVVALDAVRSRYTDHVCVRARPQPLEWIVLGFARVLYPYRQRRWRALALRHLQATRAPSLHAATQGRRASL